MTDRQRNICGALLLLGALLLGFYCARTYELNSPILIACLDIGFLVLTIASCTLFDKNVTFWNRIHLPEFQRRIL